MTSLKTIKKLEEILKCELGKEIDSNKVTKIKCKVCIKHEENIGMKGFSKLWINSTTSVKKDVKVDLEKGDVLKNMLKEILVCMLSTLKKKKNKNLGQILTIKR